MVKGKKGEAPINKESGPTAPLPQGKRGARLGDLKRAADWSGEVTPAPEWPTEERIGASGEIGRSGRRGGPAGTEGAEGPVTNQKTEVRSH